MEYIVLFKDKEGRMEREAYSAKYLSSLALAQARYDLCVLLGYEMHSTRPQKY